MDIPEGETLTAAAQNRPPQAPAYPMPPPVWPYPPPPPQRPPGRTLLGLPPLVLLILALVVVAAFAGVLVMLSGLPSGDLGTTVLDFDEEVIVGEGGHFRLDLGGSSWATYDVVLNVSSSEARAFDVYVMDANQYAAAYTNQSTNAFSTAERFENITTISTSLELPRNGRTYVLVIDNRDSVLTEGDAVPLGTLTVQLTVTVVER